MKCALVTGAGSGIGRAAALRLARKGYAAALVGRTAASLEVVAEEIRAGGGTAKGLVADVSVDSQVEVMVARVMDAYGRIDALVNCAGSAPAVPLARLATQQWRDIVESNLSSAFYMTSAVWPVMVRQFEQARREGVPAEGGAGGVVVNISSMASRDPFAGLGAYGAAKAGLNMLTMAWGREGKDCGIRVVGIAPAAVDTPMFHQLMGGKAIPEGVMLVPEDVAAMVCEAVDGALRYCSGETVFVHRRPA